MNAVDLLESQHREIEKLLSRFETTTMKRHREMLMAALTADLETHALIEEHQFYPAVRAAARSETVTLRALEAHLVGIKQILTDLVGIDADDETFMVKVRALKERVAHHVRKEEAELFPKAKRLLGPEEMRILGASLEAEQYRIAGRRRPCERLSAEPAPGAELT